MAVTEAVIAAAATTTPFGRTKFLYMTSTAIAINTRVQL